MSNLFTESTVYRPFFYPWAAEIDHEHEKMHWVEDEVPLGDDVTAWKTDRLSANEKSFVTQILRMFTQQDVAVGSVYYNSLIPVFKNNEVRNMLGGFASREKTHQRAYALLSDTLGLPEGDYAAFLDYAEMKEKYEYAIKIDTSTQEGLALALAKSVMNEGVSLFASFAMLLNFQRRGLMMGMGKIVEWSQRDEGVHVNGVAQLFRAFCQEHPKVVTNNLKHDIYDMAREIVRLEDAFIELAYNHHEVQGLTCADVKTYIRFITDRRLVQLGLKANFEIDKNPLTWLDWVAAGATHTSFFEQKVALYEAGGLQGEWQYSSDRAFTIFTRDGCPWCDLAKELLLARTKPFTEIDLTEYAARQDFYDARNFHGQLRTVPKIYLNDRLIGGYTELVANIDQL